MDAIKRNLVAALSAEAAKELQATGQTVGKGLAPTPNTPLPSHATLVDSLGPKGSFGST